ncbi:RNA polymerase sigma factor [Dyella tabacisoli]|uniref:RNA polymerase sigma factor n=1 Tax=Dyella tabacisoli TaxID=2282381 RepID=A0A369UXE7_9GAMM|nr:RNA polymerase sigma factor [Dyella tabacisoli]RDD83009.1 RNA polymerase sigma factor [Dyella tabacisoli]
MAMTELQKCFDALLREHQKIVFKVAGIYARQAEDRHDLAQEICAQLWRSFGSYDAQRGRFTTWMYRIALNVGISHARRERGQGERFEPLDEYLLDTLGGGTPITEPDERLQSLHAFIAQLDALHRALILLYLEDRSYTEIADIIGISETNVATKIHRIKQRLRGQMRADETLTAGA